MRSIFTLCNLHIITFSRCRRHTTSNATTVCSVIPQARLSLICSIDADLELPTNATIDDIKKQYRKLAKIWHPDRNAGKEEECVPRFQAIQAAHEILSDPVNKAQYDADRKVAGPFKSATAAAAAGPAQRGNPYQATSNFPPPPRRTQPGQWQRPQFRPPQTNGAERFSNFAGANVQPPKPADATQNRANAFYRAQQNQKAQERQQAQASGAGPSTANGHNLPRRPQPPPRAETKWPSEEKIRPGFKHNDTTANDSEAESRRSAWQAFKGTSPPEPGVRRSNTTRTPKRQGFDPNAPGSDERPASGHYVHRHKSEDFGRPFDRVPEDVDHASPRAQRPHIDPTNPNRRQPLPDDVPYSEANRKRTPYTSFVGEKTDVSSNMRRTGSLHDTTKFDTSKSPLRPNSTSPLGSSPLNDRKGTRFEFPSADSDAESPGGGSSSDAFESPFAKAPPLANTGERVKKVPSPPSRRFNGSQTPFSPPPVNGSDEVKSNNMYVHTTPFPSSEHKRRVFNATHWAANMFGSLTARPSQKHPLIPYWAFPNSVPCSSITALPKHSPIQVQETTIEPLTCSRADQEKAYLLFRDGIIQARGGCPESLDMGVFLMITSAARQGLSVDHQFIDALISELLSDFPLLGIA